MKREPINVGRSKNNGQFTRVASKRPSSGGATPINGAGASRAPGAGAPPGAPGAGAPGAGAPGGAGAPFGDNDAEDRFIDPAEAVGASAADAGAGEAKRPGPGPGRPPGTGKLQKEAKKVQTALEGIEGILLSLHMMVASFLNIEELNLSDAEAKKLSAAIERVAALYDFGASEKTIAWTNLAMCAGGIYGTRAFAYSSRVKSEQKKLADEKKREAAQAAPPNPTPVFQFPAAGL